LDQAYFYAKIAQTISLLENGKSFGMKIFFSLIMAVTPGLLLLRYYYRQDRDRPEPKNLVIKVFFLGVACSLFVYVLEDIVGRLNVYQNWSPILYYFFEAFIVAGLCEEYIKLRIITNCVYNSPKFDEVIDGIVYTVVASLGFACMENVVYVMNSSWHIAIARGFTAIPLHAVCSGIMGYYIGLAKRCAGTKQESFLINKGLWSAICIHGLYDFILFISSGIGYTVSVMVVPLVLWAYINLKHKIQLARAMKIH